MAAFLLSSVLNPRRLPARKSSTFQAAGLAHANRCYSLTFQRGEEKLKIRRKKEDGAIPGTAQQGEMSQIGLGSSTLMTAVQFTAKKGACPWPA
jgi:hypothetical protein